MVHTTRDAAPVGRWIKERSGIDTCWHADPATLPEFWNDQTCILVTNRKLPAVAYIDDRAIRFDRLAAGARRPGAARMIKLAGQTGLGLPLLMLGLSGENVTRLAAGEPIRVSAQHMAGLGLPQMEIVIHYGRTEEVILADLEAHGVKVRP